MASVAHEFLYDVFLSFRGEDTRYGFTGNLKKALDDKGVRTFMDDEELQKGDEITPSLLKAIEDSKITIVVLSKNYASSSFCLQELSKILESMKDKGRSVLPVFYKVDPSDVRKLKRSYSEAMDKHEASSSSHNIDNRWKTSLHQVANLSGFRYKKGAPWQPSANGFAWWLQHRLRRRRRSLLSFALALTNSDDISLSKLPQPRVKGDSVCIKLTQQEY